MKESTKHTNSPKKLINRSYELTLIHLAFEALIDKQHLLATPIVDFFGIEGIGKTRILEYISVLCIDKKLPHIKLNCKHKIDTFPQSILQQTRKYRKKSARPVISRKNNLYTHAVEAIETILESEPMVILLDGIDVNDHDLFDWIEGTLHSLIKYNNLFVVLASQQKIVFENDWSMSRKLTQFQLSPLSRDDSNVYLEAIDPPPPEEIQEIIFEWTRGYPLAMDIMNTLLQQRSFNLADAEDQKQLITILIKEVIDSKILARVTSSLDWYKACLSLLSLPRRFNLVIMQELLETYGSPVVEKLPSKLEYMGLPKRLNTNTEVLYWDLEKAGFTIDQSIRHLFFLQMRITNPDLFIKIQRFLAEQNRTLADEVQGTDSVRYLKEYLYHYAYSNDEQSLFEILQATLQKISNISLDAMIQFSEEYSQDEELQEILGKHHEYVSKFIEEHLSDEE